MRSLALDLGSTKLKLAAWSAAGLELLSSSDAPPSVRRGLEHESDPRAWRVKAEALLALHAVGSERLAIACQRSSFLLWERHSGEPVTPLVSWQDRRAAAWCARQRRYETQIWRDSGLYFSAHYAGPKLASLFEASPELRARAWNGELLFGTLDTYLVWCWTRARVHAMDWTQAARTLCLDLDSGRWSERWLACFDLPAALMPALVESSGRAVELAGGCLLTAQLADQAAALLGATGARAGTTLINFGTGAFVLRGQGHERRALERYLSGPVLAPHAQTVAAGASTFSAREHGALWVLEGTINGGAGTLDALGGGSLAPSEVALPADGFCLPDSSGVGAPHWRPEVGLTFSAALDAATPAQRAAAFIEGLAFRAAEIARDLALDPAAMGEQPIVVSGGLAHVDGLIERLAAVANRPVRALLEQEATLRGAALLASGLDPRDAHWPAAALEQPSAVPAAASEIERKFERWKAWVGSVLRAAPDRKDHEA